MIDVIGYDVSFLGKRVYLFFFLMAIFGEGVHNPGFPRFLLPLSLRFFLFL